MVPLSSRPPRPSEDQNRTHLNYFASKMLDIQLESEKNEKISEKPILWIMVYLKS